MEQTFISLNFLWGLYKKNGSLNAKYVLKA